MLASVSYAASQPSPPSRTGKSLMLALSSGLRRNCIPKMDTALQILPPPHLQRLIL